MNVALNNNVSNQNSVSPTINVAGPTTNVAGPNTSTNIAANPNMNNSPSMVNAQVCHHGGAAVCVCKLLSGAGAAELPCDTWVGI